MLKVFPYVIYPASLFVGLITHAFIYSLTANFLVSAYAGAAISGIMIFALEFYRPLYIHWKPDLAEIVKDLLFYTVLVQVIGPLSLYFIALQILIYFGFQNVVIFHIWPSDLNIFLQLLILTVAAEFFQYWWHRLSHTYRILWPAHAIHHMPGKLYSLNTSRFHIVDKIVEFCITILVFLFMGAGLEVVSYYYVFFAVTGFIQHSNLNIKLGWLDYIIASGETHRFHHDSNVGLGKCNYANNLVLWDLVFSTFKRDLESPLAKVGMLSKDLPATIIDESVYPVRMTVTESRFMIDKGLQKAISLLMPVQMKQIKFTQYRELYGNAHTPGLIQHLVLKNILSRNKDTLFGKEHTFGEIKTIEEFKLMVPIREYEAFRPYVEKIFSGELKVLTDEEPHYFTKTSGTTGKPKYIPVTKTVQDYYLKSQKIITHAVYLNEPKTFSGLFFTVVGSKEEEVLFNKWAAGSMSGKLFTLMPDFLTKKHVFPKALADMEDHEKKYLYLGALALLSPEVTLYASPNPSTLLKIYETINTKKNEIEKLITNDDEPFLKKFIHNRQHALKLLKMESPLDTKNVWPGLVSIILWKGGNCSFLLPQIKKLMKPEVHMIELGYLCSEFYGTVTIDAVKGLQIPTIMDNFFEFIEKEAYENGERNTIMVQDLKLHHDYYIIITTPGGLYRYFINDILKVKSFLGKTPVLEFIQKGKGITNFTGEKLSEYQVINFFNQSERLKNLTSFFMCLADNKTQSYTLYVEALEDAVNLTELKSQLHQYLCSVNIEYESKVASKRLPAVDIVLLKTGTGEQFKQHCLAKGQRESQFKFLYLQYTDDVDFNFDKYKK